MYRKQIEAGEQRARLTAGTTGDGPENADSIRLGTFSLLLSELTSPGTLSPAMKSHAGPKLQLFFS